MSTAGSRIARRARPTLAQRARAVAPPVVAVVLLGLAFILPDGSEADRPPGAVTVARSTYACPAEKGVSVAAGQVEAGTSATAFTYPDRDLVEALTDATRWRRGSVDAPGVVVDQAGRGSGAVGFYAGTAAKSDGGGLVVGSCPTAVDDSWYLGLGSGAKHLSTLVLTNMSPSPAVADLSLWGTQGKIDAVDADGIVVEPFSVRRLDLSDVAAGESELAVHVERLRGSLAVGALDESTAVFRGTEAVAPTAAPSRRQVVAGIPSGEDGRTLMLLNPTTSTARVSVEVIGAEGSFSPEGLESVKVDAGRFTTVRIPTSARADASALRLSSDQPVSASVRAAPDQADRAVVEAVPPLSGPAIVPVDLGSDTGEPELALTAPGRRADVRLEAYDEQMQPLAETELTIDAGTTMTADLGSSKVLDADRIAYVVVRAKGTVLGAATYTRGDRIASLALVDAPVTVLGPQVRSVG